MKAPSGTRAQSSANAALALVVTGACFVLLGGLVAAVTGPFDFEDGSWLAAYLVLVCGVSQYAMGRIRSLQNHGSSSSPSLAWWQFGTWNIGNAAVISGTLQIGTVMVIAGSVLLVFALLVALRDSLRPALPAAGTTTVLAFRTYRILLIILVVSIPVGILLSVLRN